jgi:transposase
MSSKKQTRRQFSPADKVRILRLHYLEGRRISRICEEEGLHPTLFYQWQKVFFENGTAAFASSRAQSQAAEREQAKLSALESKLRRKDEVIAEIMEDLVRTKKELGES